MDYEMIEVPVTDMRGSEKFFNLEEHGFAIFKVDVGLGYDDYHNPEQLPKYFSKLEAVLKDHLGASRVEVFRHGIRKRDDRWPSPTWQTYTHEQPATVVHIGEWVPQGLKLETKEENKDR
ncbi:MAG: hypothetical protein Q9165_002452 [Trypethelium subeluteriae]